MAKRSTTTKHMTAKMTI